ncbi:MAG: hypothetical protein QOH21_3023 [Acidobacteriota bacterium]|jgi:heat shock protein HslJ|nr:hypothetical protein [Acidobacteriota bacterium]
MNRKSLSLYLLSAALVTGATGCNRGFGHERRIGPDSATVTIQRTWPAAGIEQVKVLEVDGSVKVQSVDTNEITLVAHASGELETKAGAENQGLFETTLSGGTLRIGRHEKKEFRMPMLFGRREVRIDYELRVPRTVSLALNTVNGRISTRGNSDGEQDLVTVNGTIDAETTGSHELSATTVNGRVKAKFLQTFQGAQFRSVNGGVEALLPRSASFNVELSQLNGDFEASFPLSIHSNPGSRRVSGEVNGGRYELKITTVNGDIELSRLEEAK